MYNLRYICVIIHYVTATSSVYLMSINLCSRSYSMSSRSSPNEKNRDEPAESVVDWPKSISLMGR